MCNYWANRLVCEAADRAMQVHGGIGYFAPQALRAHLPPPSPLPDHRGQRGNPNRKVGAYLFGYLGPKRGQFG